jgi:uncharacterized membrane protein YphA (DoxX/SURF4 family)
LCHSAVGSIAALVSQAVCAAGVATRVVCVYVYVCTLYYVWMYVRMYACMYCMYVPPRVTWPTQLTFLALYLQCVTTDQVSLSQLQLCNLPRLKLCTFDWEVQTNMYFGLQCGS